MSTEMNAALMHRRHTDPVQLQVAGVCEQPSLGSVEETEGPSRETVGPPEEASHSTEFTQRWREPSQ